MRMQSEQGLHTAYAWSPHPARQPGRPVGEEIVNTCKEAQATAKTPPANLVGKKEEMRKSDRLGGQPAH
ncbi:hypothetical protein GGI03_008991, partial [Coemansia sp. RSA 2337]